MRTKEALQRYSNKRILITGGAGCIGTNLIKTLLESGPEKIIVIDDLSASYEWNLPKDSKVVFSACGGMRSSHGAPRQEAAGGKGLYPLARE